VQQTWKRLQSLIKLDHIWWGIVILGILLRVRLYLLNRSFWGDEASVAVNIVNRSFAGLTQLLDYHQAAPIGFLYIEKLSIAILGNRDYILRLFPLVAGTLAIYLLGRFSRAAFGKAGLFAVVMFSISWWLVYYSSELKQYSSDVMVALLLVYLASNCFKKRGQSKDFLLLGIAGSIMIWISHPSVFVMVGIGLALALEKLSRKEFVPWLWILGIGLGWLASFGLEYLISLRHIVADGYLLRYWRKAYAPLPPWSNKGWYLNTYFSFLFFAFHRADNVMAAITLAMTAIGAISLIIRNKKYALLVISPFVMVTIASALQRYPLKNRFMLFLIPFVFLLMAEGFRGIYGLVARWKPNIAAVFSTLLALAVVWQIAPITYEKAISGGREDIRPVIQYVAENRQPEDIIYVFYLTDPVFHYYAPLYGLDTGNIMIGVYYTNGRVAFQSFKDDVDRLYGNPRVWFIFSELVDCVDCTEGDTQGYYLNTINNFGVMIDYFDGAGANAFLYDLTP
jgi:hypothetical protein